MCNQCGKEELSEKLRNKLNLLNNPTYLIEKSFSEGNNPYINSKKFIKKSDEGYKIIKSFFYDKAKQFMQIYNEKSAGVGIFGKILNRTGIKKAVPVKELEYEEIVAISKEVFNKDEFYEVVHSYYGEELPEWFQEELTNGMSDKGIVEAATVTSINPQAQENLTNYFYKWTGGYMQKVQSQIEDVVLYGFDEGKSTNNIAKDIVKHIKKIGKNNAKMIARTESIRVSSEISAGVYKDIGVKQYEVLPATTACPVCKAKASKNPYKIEDRSGMPPFHPNCRDTIIPVLEE